MKNMLEAVVLENKHVQQRPCPGKQAMGDRRTEDSSIILEKQGTMLRMHVAVECTCTTIHRE
jgi:hypothetical protein